MSLPRLELALEAGLSLPEGRVAVFAPRAGVDLSALRDVQVVTGFLPDAAFFRAAGLDVVTEAEGRYAAAMVCLPRSKARARALVAEAAMRTDGPVIVDGLKSDGIEAVLKDVRRRVDVNGPINKAHGKLFWFTGGDFRDWSAPGDAEVEGGWITAPGVFSEDGVDPASALLAESLPDTLSGHFADLGAGWGYLSARLLERPGVASVALVEAEHAALACARRNVADPRATFHWADATAWRPEVRLDGVITNPPFHTARQADPALGRAFIDAAARILRPGGRLWLVANRHLPYEAALIARFDNVAEIAGTARFKVLSGTIPSRHGSRDKVV